MVVRTLAGGLVREVAIEAVGDDFAQVSGQWLSGARVAKALTYAHHAWAFAAHDALSAETLLDALAHEANAWVVGIAPGLGSGWDAQGADVLFRLLDGAWTGAVVGLALAMEPPPCAAYEEDGACSHCLGVCGGRGARIEGDVALYPCNRMQHT